MICPALVNLGEGFTATEWFKFVDGWYDGWDWDLTPKVAGHPSTSFKQDPEAKYVTEIFAYCRERPDILLCTCQNMYRWIANEKKA